MAQTKKRKTKSWSSFGILNHMGEPWTPRTFESAPDAEEYIRDWVKWTKIDLPKHKVVAVRVTITPHN